MFLPAKDDADGLVFIVQPNITIEVIDIHLHLAEILMGELADFQVNQYVAAQ